MLASMTLGLSGPAFAHAQLLISTPKVGATVYVLPTKISLTFDDDLISLGEAANQIQVTDPKGKRIDSGATALSGAVLTVKLKTSKVLGKFRVTYRVISADGHPVSGSYPFYLATKPKR